MVLINNQYSNILWISNKTAYPKILEDVTMGHVCYMSKLTVAEY